MGAKVRRIMGLICLPLIVAGLVCFAVALRFAFRQQELSGVPWGRIALNTDGRKFYTQRGGGPLEQRSQVPMTDEQYRLWEVCEERARDWALPGVACWMAGVAILAVLGELRRRKAQQENQLPQVIGPLTGSRRTTSPGGPG
jgi:hypothetical protein